MSEEQKNQNPETENASETTEKTETKSVNTGDQVEKADSQEKTDEKFNSDEIVKKLKSRLGKEQAQKNDALDELAEMRKEFEKLKNENSKSKMSADERNKKVLSEKDDQIAKLQAELKHRDAVAEVDGVFKDSGIDVGPVILDMVTTDNPDDTYSNAQAIIDLINKVREDSRKDFLKGTTPKASGAKKPASGKSLSKMSLLEIAQLKRTDPDTYREKAKQLGWIK